MSGALEPIGARRTLAAQAHDAVRAAIAEGRLVPGRQYSVAGLAEQLGVSRTPVREALLVLEREGIVRFDRNRGVRVLEASAADLEEVFTLRLLLEVPATRRAAGRLGDAGIEALGRELAAMEALCRRGDERAFMAHDQRFHELILEAAGNARLAAIVGRLRDQVRARGASTVGRSRELPDVLAEHVAILDALRAGDAERAAGAMHAHLVHTATLLLGRPPSWPEPGAPAARPRRRSR